VSGEDIEALRRLVQVAETRGWSQALFEHTKREAAEGWPSPEDERVADWRYLVRWVPDGVALVFGCGRGVVPVALSECFGTVYAADGVWERAAFLAIRAKQAGIGNLHSVVVGGAAALPFCASRFDFVAMGGSAAELTQRMPAEDFVRIVHRLLKPGGTAQLSLGNRWGFDYLLGRGGSEGGPRRHSLAAYLRILRGAGFSDVRVYAPLPRHRGVPMFYVPLDGSTSMRFFLRNLSGLFDAVSPEVKRRHAVEYRLAKLGVRMTLLWRAEWLMKRFLPGFCIFAEKSGKPSSPR
jgi:SAM-dependent methyltransferase